LFGDKKEGAWKIRQEGPLEVFADSFSDLKKGCRTMNAGIISLGVGRLLSYTPFDASPSWEPIQKSHGARWRGFASVFQGTKRSGNTRGGITRARNTEKPAKHTIPSGCGDNRTGGFVGSVVTARCGDAPTKPPYLRSILAATGTMRILKRLP
jgi:hypothetical protein